MVSVLRLFNETVAKPFEVRHTSSELNHLADYLLKSLNSETRAIMEHTGRHYKQIAQYLNYAGISVSAMNPKLNKDYGNGNSLRHVRTDRADARKNLLPTLLMTAPSASMLPQLYPGVGRLHP